MNKRYALRALLNLGVLCNALARPPYIIGIGGTSKTPQNPYDT